jgi:HNH endonuclease
MIKIRRIAPPDELTTEVVEGLTKDFLQDNGKAVWNQTYIRRALLLMSHGKCVYCETRIDEESKYMEVDHFYSKGRYPGQVLQWDNLLPSCKRCNTNKGDHDVVANALIDPTVQRPRDHVFMRNYRLYGQDPVGRSTVDVLYLNQTDRVVRNRFDVGTYVEESLDALRELWDANVNNPRVSGSVARKLVALMKEAQPASEYSATAATSIANSPTYAYLRTVLEGAGIWTNEFDDLEKLMIENDLS